MEWKCNVPLNDIVDINDQNMFITKKGELYLFGGLFSNNEYCKKVESTYTFTRFINNALITNDNKIFAYYDNKFIEEMTGWTGAFDYSKFKKYPNLILFSKEFGSYYSNEFSYAVVEGKEVYLLVDERDATMSLLILKKLK